MARHVTQVDDGFVDIYARFRNIAEVDNLEE
jgi:hypothetical protein